MNKTNYQLMTELDKVYTPKRFGIISEGEYELIHCGLMLDAMDDLALQNMRDFVVMYYHVKIVEAHAEGTGSMDYSDKMSAITYVIDDIKFKRGLEV